MFFIYEKRRHARKCVIWPILGTSFSTNRHMSIVQGVRCLFVGLRGCLQCTGIQLFDRFFDGLQSKGGLKTFYLWVCEGLRFRSYLSCSTQNDPHFFPRKMCFCCYCFGWARNFQNHPGDAHVRTFTLKVGLVTNGLSLG